MRQDGSVHPADVNRPRLRDEDVDYYDAYRSLGLSRTWNQAGPMPIANSEMLAFFQIEGITGQAERSRYRTLIQMMDQVELKHVIDSTAKK